MIIRNAFILRFRAQFHHLLRTVYFRDIHTCPSLELSYFFIGKAFYLGNSLLLFVIKTGVNKTVFTSYVLRIPARQLDTVVRSLNEIALDVLPAVFIEKFS